MSCTDLAQLLVVYYALSVEIDIVAMASIKPQRSADVTRDIPYPSNSSIYDSSQQNNTYNYVLCQLSAGFFVCVLILLCHIFGNN